MTLQHLQIQCVRNHHFSELELREGATVIWGENGAGKTTILESISLVCTSRSLVSSLDRSFVQTGTEQLVITGNFRSDHGSLHEISLSFPDQNSRRSIMLDFSPVQTSADLIGRFPLVVLAPQHGSITSGGPSERRAFLDFIISQTLHSYLLDLIEYKKVIRHRNALLATESLSDTQLLDELEPWNASFVRYAARIMIAREKFLTNYIPYALDALNAIVRGKEQLSMRYVPAVEFSTESDDVRQLLSEELRKKFRYERRRGSTLVGPHRDELEIMLNDLDVRTHASQGQHKSILIALKIAEANYIADRLDERPLLLLDDVFAELDDGRLENVLRMLNSVGQTFLTTANRSVLHLVSAKSMDGTFFEVSGGNVMQLKEAA